MILPAIAYRSPTGRVRCYDGCAVLTLDLPPGSDADRAWSELAPEIKHDGATWVDRVAEAETRARKAPKKETIEMTTLVETPGPAPAKAPRKNPAKARKPRRNYRVLEERLNSVLDCVEAAKGLLTSPLAGTPRAQVHPFEEVLPVEVPYIAHAVDHLSKAQVIGEGGDLLQWYAERVGV